MLRLRQARRADDFLDLVRRVVYAHPPSPYRALLRHAGVEYDDLAGLVGREGVEGALRGSPGGRLPDVRGVQGSARRCGCP